MQNVAPSDELSFPSFGRRLVFSELLRQDFWFWLQQVSSLWQLSLPSFGRRLAFSGLLRRVFSFLLREFSSVWPRLQPEPVTPAWTVSECDGGHGETIGCAQPLPPSAAQCLRGFGARPQGIPESF
jgi:hypothetical protein